MAGIYSRRQRMESSRSVDSLPLTPADEHSSWLGDDVCANCGTAVHVGLLYCSQQCRQQDAAAATRAAQLASAKSTMAPSKSSSLSSSSSSSTSASASAAAEAAAAAATAKSSTTSTSTGNSASTVDMSATRATAAASSASPRLNATSSSAPVDKFRYTCPPSPSIMAKYSAALTSPALTALERSMLPRDSKGGSSQGQSAKAPASTRRSSSRSTYSSTSEAISTDPSTPSPALVSSHSRTGRIGGDSNNDDDDDDVEDWEPTDLYLPPSIVSPSSNNLAATTALLTNKHHNPDKSPAATTAALVAPSSSAALATRSPRRSSGKKDLYMSSKQDADNSSSAAMNFARRPSNTNLPPPVLFTSPVLATTMTNTATAAATRTAANVHLATLRRRPDDRTQRVSPPKLPMQHDTSASSARRAEAMPMNSAGQVSTRERGSRSPPQLASAASSAGKTLKAISPLTSVLPLVRTVCGRFGCQGASGSVESFVAEEKDKLSAASPKSIKTTSATDIVETTEPRAALMSRHKHTHSAVASLERQRAASPRESSIKSNQLFMTPVETRRGRAQASPRDERARGRERDHNDDEEDERIVPSRGRSHARGRRSTSRRSPSPPRGVARRGRSEDLLASKLHRSRAQSPPAAYKTAQPPVALASSNKSNPISISRSNGDECQSSSSSSFHGDNEETDIGRRGRSPGIRTQGRRAASPLPSVSSPVRKPTSRDRDHVRLWSESCEMAWPAYGHPEPEDNVRSGSGNGKIGALNGSIRKRMLLEEEVAAAVAVEAGGYDDVELDGL